MKKIIKATGTKKSKPAPSVNHNLSNINIFKERSTSLKPERSELKSQKHMPPSAGIPPKHSVFSFRNHTPTSAEHELKTNQSYCYPPKPHGMDLNQLSVSKENINPNMTNCHQDDLSSSKVPLPHQRQERDRPSSARGPSFEFKAGPDQKQKISAKRKSMSKTKKFKVNKDNEIKIRDKSPFEAMHGVEHYEAESPHSEQTAFQMDQKWQGELGNPQLGLENSEIKSLKKQNKEMKQMIGNLSQTVSMLAGELNKHMSGMNLAFNDQANKVALLENEVRYLRQMQNSHQ